LTLHLKPKTMKTWESVEVLLHAPQPWQQLDNFGLSALVPRSELENLSGRFAGEKYHSPVLGMEPRFHANSSSIGIRKTVLV